MSSINPNQENYQQPMLQWQKMPEQESALTA